MNLLYYQYKQIRQFLNIQSKLSEMSATKYLSPLRIESDQKDVIASKLKEELYQLKQNEQQFYSLEDQYRKLEHKYKVLAEEKALSDNDYKNRHEIALKNIHSLKVEMDELKTELRDANLEMNDLSADENTLRNQLDQRNIDIEKLKAELHSLFADADQLANARATLQATSDKTKATNAHLSNQLHNLDIQNEDIMKKIGQTQKYLDQLLIQEKLLKQKIISYENENNNLDTDINTTLEDIAILENQIYESQDQVKMLQADIAGEEGAANKYKSQSIHYHRATQAEIMKNNDLTKELSQAQNISRVRDNQIQQGRRVVESLQCENEKIMATNNKLEDDLQFCRKHLQTLSLINQDLVQKIDRFSREDEEVTRIINRKGVVTRMKGRVEQTTNFLNKTNVSNNISGYSRSRYQY